LLSLFSPFPLRRSASFLRRISLPAFLRLRRIAPHLHRSHNTLVLLTIAVLKRPVLSDCAAFWRASRAIVCKIAFAKLSQ
jgi:hypothetical protein